MVQSADSPNGARFVSLTPGPRSCASGTSESTSRAAESPWSFADGLAQLPADVPGALDLGVRLGQRRASPGDGTTRQQWELLATIAAYDLGIARALEPHLDAVAILVQAGYGPIDGRWGVFAAEGGDEPLRAEWSDNGWVLTGIKPWCSLASTLDNALVTAHTDSGESRLFAVRLDQDAVELDATAWESRGLAEIPSGPIRCHRATAEPIGPAGWYVSREGFAWGGIGVAACWYGGAVAIGRRVHESVTSRPNPHAAAHLGAIDTLLHACAAVLADAANRADDHSSTGRIIAKRARGLVARSCEEIIVRAGHALGPGPLVNERDHGKRIADLHIYIRQHHAERDDEKLGTLIAASAESPW